MASHMHCRSSSPVQQVSLSQCLLQCRLGCLQAVPDCAAEMRDNSPWNSSPHGLPTLPGPRIIMQQPIHASEGAFTDLWQALRVSFCSCSLCMASRCKSCTSMANCSLTSLMSLA